MIRNVLTRASLTIALAVSLPLSATAQEPVTTPEEVEWHLVSAGATEVPWHVDITLTLSAGAATGSVACNSFSGSYSLDGEMLTFDPPLATTQRGCPIESGDIVDAYLAALPEVTGWSVDGEALFLAGADDAPLLSFEQAVVALTPSDVASLVSLLEEQQAVDQRLAAAVDGLDKRVDNMRIGVLRDRIKALEAAAAADAGPDRSAFSAAEKVLLGAVRKDIAKTCEPRRSENPAGTIAALQCKPNAPEVSDMAYYLMESKDAAKVWNKRMQDNDVKDGRQNRSCALGKPSQMHWTGGGFEVAGCYRNEDGRANLRFVDNAAQCRQVTAGSTQVKNPSIYIAVLGPDRDIASLWGWATRSAEWQTGSKLFDPIKQSGQPWSDQCPHG